jgi:hypothetical protein
MDIHVIQGQEQGMMPKAMPFYSLINDYNYVETHYPEKWSRISTEMTKIHKMHKRNWPTSGQCGKNVFWKIDTNNYRMIISGKGKMDYSFFDYRWFVGVYSWHIESVEIKDGVSSICEAAFENLKIQRVTLGKSLKTISNHAFSYCLLLSDIKGGENISFIGDSAFMYTGMLYNLNLSSIEQIGSGAFRRSEIINITMGGELKKLGKEAFYGCVSLKTVLINSLKEIEDKTFEGCYNLKYVLLPANLLYLGKDIFSGCEELKEIILPNTILKIGDNAFYNCTKLKKINIPPKIREVPNSCFSGCFALSNIEIPEGSVKLGKRAFSNTSLENILIPEGITEIGEECFYLCDLMLNAELPSTITTIKRAAFASTPLLKTIKLKAITPPVLEEPNLMPETIIAPPCGAVEKYKEAKGWTDIKNQIKCNEN